MAVRTLEWRDGALWLIDQTRLPTEHVEVACRSVDAVWDAIKRLVVRGAPAIGVAAAYGVALGAQMSKAATAEALLSDVERVCDYLATSRPTAVNLFWALDRMRAAARASRGLDVAAIRQRLLDEAHAICEEDRAIGRRIGEHGRALIADGQTVLTHCNAGGLATAEFGTALAVIFAAHEAGTRVAVYADETRPLLQGARLTTWELQQAGIDVTLICDSMAARVMGEGRIDLVITGADRIAANGDAANKIGTYGVALLAKAHGIPFYIAAPKSTFDMTLAGGEAIPIEQRDPLEVTHGFGRQTAPTGVKVYNPAFDVTPHDLIAAFITEDGIVRPPYDETLRALFAADKKVGRP
ncbi:MAG: S-methyl-5-thioribose-1-phosphate isomerase [Verrucomicrobia bacterium]|nr:S-methyl-5-thioribose-1-phosphate isomerase [Verrucomicrobiota bacterium]